MSNQASTESLEAQAPVVGNPMITQVRDFIDQEDMPAAIDPIGIIVRALRGQERRVAIHAILVGLALALCAYQVVKPSYQSSGMLRILPTEGKILYSDRDKSRLQLYDAFYNSEKQLLTSRPVLEKALDKLQRKDNRSFPLPNDIGDLNEIISVSGKKGLIYIAARSIDPSLSAAAVNAVMASFLESTEAARNRSFDVRREELLARESELEVTLAGLNKDYLEVGEEHDSISLARAHVTKTAQLEAMEERLAELASAISQLRATGGVGAGLSNKIEVQRATLLDQALSDMTFERAKRLASLETLKGRYSPSHPKLRSAQVELKILEGAIEERRDQIVLLGQAGALPGTTGAGEQESVKELQNVVNRVIERRDTVRTEAAELNGKLIRIRGLETEKERLEGLLVETKRALDEVLVESQNNLSRLVEVVSMAKIPNGPIIDKRKSLALGAFLFGAAGTVSLVIGVSLLAGRVRFSDGLNARATDILGAVIGDCTTPGESMLQAASKLRNELDLRWPIVKPGPQVIGIIGTGPQAGVSTLAHAMGVHYANAGLKVLLIDADTGSNGLSQIFSAEKTVGPEATARREGPLEEAVQIIGEKEDRLKILASPFSADARKAFACPRELALNEMRTLLDITRTEYEMIILDLGVLTAGKQSAVGAVLADRNVLVTSSGVANQALLRCLDLLDRLACPRYVLALNRAPKNDPALMTDFYGHRDVWSNESKAANETYETFSWSLKMFDNKIAIIDDDPFIVAHLKDALTSRLPNCNVVGIIEPVAPAGFDVYIVDKEFDGDSMGEDVVQRIRSISPDSLVLAYSSHLDRDFLRALLREGCEGAFDKGSLEELDSMINIIESYFADGRPDKHRIRGVGNTIMSISGLLREWNRRLDNNGRAHMKTYSDS